MQGKIFVRWLLVSGLGLVVTALLISLPASVRAQQGRMPVEGDSRQSPGLQTGTLFLLEVAPPAFEVTLTPGALLVQTMTITNIGPGALSFTIAEFPGDVPWLSENPTSADLSVGGALPVEVTFDATGLAPGLYTTTLVVATNQTGDSPVMVPVTMTVTGPNVLYLPLVMKNFSSSPGSLFLLEVTPSAFTVTLGVETQLIQTMTVTYIGPGALSFTVAEFPNDVPWLAENPTSASLSAGEALPVEVTFDATGLTPGLYTTTLVIATNQTGDSPVMVPVAMTVIGPNVLYLPLVMKNSPPPPVSPPSCAPERLADILVGNQPRGLAVDEARRRVYVANHASSSVSIIDGQTNTVINTVTNFPAISAPTGIAYAAASDTIWVGNAGSENGVNTYWLTPIDASTFAVGTPVPVGREPWGIAFNPVDKLVYAANQGDNTVSVISPTLNSVVKTVGVGQRPYNLAVHRGTGLVYVANFGAKSVSVLEPGGSFLFNIPLDFGSDEPFGIAVDDVLDNYVYITTVKSHRIETIDIDNGHQLLPWTEFKRLNGHGAPLRALALNLTLGTADGGHLWTTTSTTDMSDATQVLLIPKGYRSGFNRPIPDDYEDPTGGGLISAGIAIDTVIDRTYVSLPASNAVRVFGDRDGACVLPFLANDKTIVVSGP